MFTTFTIDYSTVQKRSTQQRSTQQRSTQQRSTQKRRQHNNRSSDPREPFCKVCFDMGKPASEYTSHWVRDRPGGKVTCPHLLQQECRYCHEQGHTPKHCPALKKRDARRLLGVQRQASRQAPRRPTRPLRRAPAASSPQVVPENESKFAALESDSESETEEAPKLNIPRPVLKRSLRADDLPQPNLSYAGAAKKDYVHAITPTSSPTKQSTPECPPAPKKKPAPAATTSQQPKSSSWADYSDEELDEEEWASGGNQTGFDSSGINMEW